MSLKNEQPNQLVVNKFTTPDHQIEMHSQINYGMIFWGSSSSMRNVFIIQKRAIGIMLRLGPRSSCWEGFKKLDILTVPCFYIYVLMLFVAKNPKNYQTNTSVHAGILGNNINCMYLLWDLPQYREVSIIHLLKYLITFHKIFKKFITIYIFLRLC
jgi:hypothetical protein